MRTEAGKALYRWLTEPWSEPSLIIDHASIAATIATIEEQAVAPMREAYLAAQAARQSEYERAMAAEAKVDSLNRTLDTIDSIAFDAIVKRAKAQKGTNG